MNDILPPVYYLFFWFLVGHALCDTSLQPQRLSDMKRAPGWLGWMALSGHGLIHGGAVALVTNSVPLGIAETVLHTFIDRLSCKAIIDLKTDQILHVLPSAARLSGWLDARFRSGRQTKALRVTWRLS